MEEGLIVAQSASSESRRFESCRLHQIQCSCEVQAERASGDRAQEGSRNVYLSGLTASRRHAAVTAGKDRHPPQCRRSSVGRAPRQEVCRWFKSNRLHHRRDLLPRSRTERKPAKVVFPVRCTKAAGRSNLCIGWHRLCKDERMRPTYRRRAEKFRGWFGCRRVRRKSEAKPVDVEAAWWRLSLDKAAV